jgi:putative PIN family toxin of toxin-antitoxin system
MTVCIDTNVVLQARAVRHRFGVILDLFAAGRIDWAVSMSIVTEYQEVITGLAGPRHWERFAVFLSSVHRLHLNLLQFEPWFAFHVIPHDADDNKFTDCAIAAHANYVITEDAHFAPLADAG